MRSVIDLIRKNGFNSLIFTGMLLLPWINVTHSSTFIFIALAILCLINKQTYRIGFSGLLKMSLFWILSGYFVLQLISFFNFPQHENRAAIDQKLSFLLIPALFFILINTVKKSWQIAKYGFVAGNIVACLACTFTAIFSFLESSNFQSFFYHAYSGVLGQGAVYFSLYLSIAIIYSISFALSLKKNNNTRGYYLFLLISMFFFINILLLSSKLIIVTFSVLTVAFFISQNTFKLKTKLYYSLGIGLIAAIVLFTNNPISARYKAIKLDTYSASLTGSNFNNFNFDGLNFRIFLWRVGLEIAGEKNSFLMGNGAKHYHEFLNNKIINYGLYTGNGKNDSGYLNYNLHNQYMESFVQFGLPGLLLIVAFIASTLIAAFRYNNGQLKFIILLFGIAFLTESVLETQAGILLVTIFISGEWIALLKQKHYTQEA